MSINRVPSVRGNFGSTRLSPNQLQKAIFQKELANSGIRNTSLVTETSFSGGPQKMPYVNDSPPLSESPYDGPEYSHSSSVNIHSNTPRSNLSGSTMPVSNTQSNLSRLSGSNLSRSTLSGSPTSSKTGGYRKSRRKPRRNPRRNCHRTSLRKPRKKSYRKTNK